MLCYFIFSVDLILLIYYTFFYLLFSCCCAYDLSHHEVVFQTVEVESCLIFVPCSFSVGIPVQCKCERLPYMEWPICISINLYSKSS